MILEMLSQEEIWEIHRASLKILEGIGVRVEHEEMRMLLRERGCSVRENRVRFPQALVEDGISKIPGGFSLYGRDGTREVRLGDEQVYFQNGGGMPQVIDFETGHRRAPTTEDTRNMARILDALTHVHIVSGVVAPREEDPAMGRLMQLVTTLENTRKPLSGPAVISEIEVRYIVQLAAAVRGSVEALREHPILVLSFSPVSPLHYPERLVDALMEIARLGLPLGLLPAPMLGATGPMTLAGALAQQNAEILAGIAMAYQVTPGLPVLYFSRISAVDMRRGLSAWGNPEVGITGACAVQLARFYGLPSNVYGLSTSAKVPDV